MKIIKATENDLSLIIEMKMKMFESFGIVDMLQDNVANLIREKYKQLYHEDKLCHFILYEEENPVAIGGALIKDDVPFCFFKTPYYGYVVDVYCIPDARKKGYATEIMKNVIQWLEEKEVRSIKLMPSHLGRIMYEKMGFVDSGEMEKSI